MEPISLKRLCEELDEEIQTIIENKESTLYGYPLFEEKIATEEDEIRYYAENIEKRAKNKIQNVIKVYKVEDLVSRYRQAIEIKGWKQIDFRDNQESIAPIKVAQSDEAKVASNFNTSYSFDASRKEEVKKLVLALDTAKKDTELYNLAKGKIDKVLVETLKEIGDQLIFIFIPSLLEEDGLRFEQQIYSVINTNVWRSVLKNIDKKIDSWKKNLNGIIDNRHTMFLNPSDFGYLLSKLDHEIANAIQLTQQKWNAVFNTYCYLRLKENMQLHTMITTSFEDMDFGDVEDMNDPITIRKYLSKTEINEMIKSCQLSVNEIWEMVGELMAQKRNARDCIFYDFNRILPILLDNEQRPDETNMTSLETMFDEEWDKAEDGEEEKEIERIIQQYIDFRDSLNNFFA